MDIKKRLICILNEYGWSRYKLAKESGLPEATLTNIFSQGTIPTIDTLEKICTTLNISLADFFADGERVELTPKLKEFYEHWLFLSPEKRANILQTMKFMK